MYAGPLAGQKRGVQCPASQPYLNLGSPNLQLECKPQPNNNRISSPTPSQSSRATSHSCSTTASRPRKLLDPVAPRRPRAERDDPLRALIRSSTQRLVSCHAGKQSAHHLVSSVSAPAIATCDHLSAPFPPTPTREQHKAEDGDEAGARDACAASPVAWRDAGADAAESPAAPAARAHDLHHHPTPPSSQSTGDRAPARRRHVTFRPESPSLAARSASEFEAVQKASRAKLAAQLEERQRLRESVFALRHVGKGLETVVEARSGLKASESAPVLPHHRPRPPSTRAGALAAPPRAAPPPTAATMRTSQSEAAIDAGAASGAGTAGRLRALSAGVRRPPPADVPRRRGHSAGARVPLATLQQSASASSLLASRLSAVTAASADAAAAASAAGGGAAASAPPAASLQPLKHSKSHPASLGLLRSQTAGVRPPAPPRAPAPPPVPPPAARPARPPTFWREASRLIGGADGGALRLWQALHAKTERREAKGEGARWLREAPDEAAEVVEQLFDALRQALAASEPPPPVAPPLVEELFRSLSPTMISREGGRELLLPLLRIAAEHAGVESEELRRMTVEHAFPAVAEAAEAGGLLASPALASPALASPALASPPTPATDEGVPTRPEAAPTRPEAAPTRPAAPPSSVAVAPSKGLAAIARRVAAAEEAAAAALAAAKAEATAAAKATAKAEAPAPAHTPAAEAASSGGAVGTPTSLEQPRSRGARLGAALEFARGTAEHAAGHISSSLVVAARRGEESFHAVVASATAAAAAAIATPSALTTPSATSCSATSSV